MERKQKIVSKEHLSKYEISGILHIRCILLTSGGSSPLVEYTPNMSPIEIAKKEFDNNKLDFIVRRKFPSGLVEDCHVKNMKTIK